MRGCGSSRTPSYAEPSRTAAFNALFSNLGHSTRLYNVVGEHMRIYTVRGKSMLPSISDGERLLVSTGMVKGGGPAERSWCTGGRGRARRTVSRES